MESVFIRKKIQVKTPNEFYIIFNSVPMRILFDKMLNENFRNEEGKFESRTFKRLAKIELTWRMYSLFLETAHLPFLRNDKIPVFTQ